MPCKLILSAVGDTGLELASGAQVRPYSPVLLAYGALRSAQVRSNCYQNCYQVRAVRGAGKDRSHASCSSSSSDAISAYGGYLSSRESKRRGPAIGRISGRLRCGRRVLILVWCLLGRRAQRQVAAGLGTNRWIASYAWSWISGSRKSGRISAWSMTGPVIVLAALA